LAERLPQITFYEGKYFTGRKLKVCGNCDNFQDRGFMNRVNSICVQSGAWISFDHPDFQGQQYVLEHGEYPGFYRCNGYNDHKGSCRPVGIVSANFHITEWRHFSGHCMEFTEECSFLQGQGWNKNCVNAIKVNIFTGVKMEESTQSDSNPIADRPQKGAAQGSVSTHPTWAACDPVNHKEPPWLQFKPPFRQKHTLGAGL
uniref:Crystallin gamma N n=1 Tax=Chelonoidis abingdonii TaxID=106734 RepID=A0A8C0GEN9_CHEAB